MARVIWLLPMLVLPGLVAGCSLGAYECTSEASCLSGGVKGKCVAAPDGARYCAFAASDCKSRLRWDDSAGVPLSNECVVPADMAGMSSPDLVLTPDDEPDMEISIGPCEPGDPECTRFEKVAPFPLQRDPIPDPAATDTGLERNADGDLVIGRPPAGAAFLWVANPQDAAFRGTVSKFDTRALREVARYLSVTCGSLKSGNTMNCDGVNGCCAADDVSRYRARKAHGNEPARQQVRAMQSAPSQTAVDLNGDAFVENVGNGGQASLTKIGNSVSACIDRNRNGRIETSSDTSMDGQIQVDCNGDNQPDDVAGVQGKPCLNGLKQEFYGLDDECVLWTTNIDDQQQPARAMALASGGSGTGGADAWVVTSFVGRFYRVDGASGLIRDDGQLAQDCRANAMTIDATGIAWTTPNFQGPLCYFDTRTPQSVGRARTPDWGMIVASGSTIDRDQNIWMGGWGQSEALRYTPVREKGIAALGTGRWVRISRAGSQGGAQASGRGIAADSRSQSTYYVWLAESLGYMVRIPGSSLDKLAPGPGDQTIDGSAFPVYRAAGQGVGAAIDSDQNVWTVGTMNGMALTRTKVDSSGTATPPVINGQPMGQNLCPAGDTCSIKGNQSFTDTDSDISGFALRNFGRGRGSYTWTLPGCKDGNGIPGSTSWFRVSWVGTVPAGSTLAARARSGPTASPDNSWGSRTVAAASSPLDLRALLFPNDNADAYLQVEFLFTPSSNGATPSLHSFAVDYRCP